MWQLTILIWRWRRIRRGSGGGERRRNRISLHIYWASSQLTGSFLFVIGITMENNRKRKFYHVWLFFSVWILLERKTRKSNKLTTTLFINDKTFHFFFSLVDFLILYLPTYTHISAFCVRGPFFKHALV